MEVVISKKRPSIDGLFFVGRGITRCQNTLISIDCKVVEAANRVIVNILGVFLSVTVEI